MTRATPAAPTEPALRIRIADKTYPSVAGSSAHRVLRHIDIDVAANSFVVLTGPSGCGKSTLLNIVAGLDRDFTGLVRFTPPEPRMSFVFQTPRLLPWRTVEENIALALPDGDARLAAIPGLLARVGLGASAKVYPERLSLGMQRRVALARAFIVEPDVLFMDEPFVSLDEATAESLRRLLLEQWHLRPCTVLFITHDAREAVMLATRILRLSGPDATIAQDTTVTLSRDARLDADALRREQALIFGAS